MIVLDERETESMVDDKLAAFEQRMDNRMATMSASITELATSVRLLADRDIRMQERENHQQSFNQRMGANIDKLQADIGVIQLARAEEKHAVDAVKRSYVWIILLGILGPIIMTGVGMAWVKSSLADVGGGNRAVVPLIQNYDPSNPPRQIESVPAPRR